MSQNLDPGGIQSNFKGISYQVKLILLAVIKSFQNPTITHFQVTTEIKEANPFDDAIVELSDGTTRYVQCKHINNPKELDLNLLLKRIEIIEKNNKKIENKNENFHLPKYFAGYIKINENFKKSADFAICTTNYLPDPPILLDGSDKISFVKHTGSDAVFGMFNNYFKFDSKCTETKATIRRRLVKDLRKDHTEETIDKYLDGFLSDLLFVLNLERNDIDKEIEVFVQNHFKWPEIDSLKWSLMSILYSWIENMKTVQFIMKQDFREHLENIKAKCITNSNVIDRSLALFRLSDFEFEACGTITDFVKEIEKENVQTRKFYMQTKENETFYGSYMINQEQKEKPFRFFFLSTKFPFDILDGLKFFSLENCFNILVFVENTKQSIENRHMVEIKKILTSNIKKRLLIITDQAKSKFEKDLLADDENLLTMPEIKLKYLKQGSLKKFLDKKELKFQDETVTFNSILDSSDQNLIDEINLKDLENTDSIGHNVTLGKNFDSDLYVSRQLVQRNVIKGDILKLIKEENEVTVTDEQSFDTKCRHYPDANVHLLVPQAGGNLRWERTRGQINFLFNYLIPEQETNLIESPWDTQITADGTKFVLSDVPGMGKTSWLNHLAKELKKNDHYKHHFIVNISFNDHHTYFEDHTFENSSSVIQFLGSEGLKLQSDIGRKLFQAACIKSKNVQVILDGLDEVCPECEQKIFRMIEIISEMRLSGLYISTRPELKRSLENKLQNFCHEFRPFSENDQLQFLTKFWRKKRQLSLTDAELQVVAEKAILLVRDNKLTEITGIPLITKILAEIFDSDMISEATQDDSSLKKTFNNLSELYKAFVDKKIERYVIEKLELNLSKEKHREMAKDEKKKLIILYKKIAIKLILSQYSEIFNESQSFEYDSNEFKDMTKCGLILGGSDIKFLHRTIAEYFAYLKILEKFNDEKVAKFVVQKILCEDKFGVIRSFLNSSIEEISSKPIEELYGKNLLESEDDCKKSMKTACAEKNTKIYDFIFKSLFAWKLRNVNSA